MKGFRGDWDVRSVILSAAAVCPEGAVCPYRGFPAVEVATIEREIHLWDAAGNEVRIGPLTVEGRTGDSQG